MNIPNLHDTVRCPIRGKGLVVKIFPESGVYHVDYSDGGERKGYRIYSRIDPIRKTRKGWQIPDSVTYGRKIEGHVEIFFYRYHTKNLYHWTKPFYKTPAGRLGFSYSGGLDGLNPASLGVVHVQKDGIVMYLLQKDPIKEKRKAQFWRTVATQLQREHK